MIDKLDLLPIIQIEDDHDDQVLVQKALQALSITNPVHFFNDGHQALEYLRVTSEQPLVILCDVKMPGMDGFELRDQIDADTYLREKAIPFVFFSTWATKDLVNRAYQGPIQGYHQKKGSFEELKQELSLIIAYWKRCKHPNQF